jgi:hypothetical protein
VIFALICRSALHETPMPIGSEAPWRGEADHAHVVAEILAAELRADAEVLRQLVDLGFQLRVADGVARLAALGRQRIEPAGGGELHRLERSSPPRCRR